MTPLQRALASGVAGVVLVSAGLLGFLGRWEGDGQTVVYADQLAGGLPTVCKGITPYTSSRPLVIGDEWTDAECDAEERRIVWETQQALARCITVDGITQSMLDAITSHAHNFGWPATCGSAFMALINAGQFEAGCRGIAWHPDGRPAWAYVNGRFVPGLHNRRLAEMELCLR